MKLYAVNTGFFKLDGGAMHGVVPKALWKRYNEPDENNMCNWAMRCLLIETEDKRILIDNGLGNKQDDKFFGYYFLNGDDSLRGSLDKHGFSVDDITDNWLTHLHFDHCGGGFNWNGDRTGYEPVFKNATYHTHKRQWDWALNPNAREKASFLKENILPMQESGHLNFLDDASTLDPKLSFELVFGHTEAMMLPKIEVGEKTVLFMADLCPSVAHIKIAWVLGYDIRPLDTMKERSRILEEAAENGWILFFEHDALNECCTLKKTEKGVAVDEIFRLNEVF